MKIPRKHLLAYFQIIITTCEMYNITGSIYYRTKEQYDKIQKLKSDKFGKSYIEYAEMYSHKINAEFLKLKGYDLIPELDEYIISINRKRKIEKILKRK